MRTLARQSPRRAQDFRLLWTGETTSMLGSTVTSTALPLVAVVTLQASKFSVGLLTVAAWLPWLAMGLPAGAWVDRLPRRPISSRATRCSMLVFASGPLAASLDVLTMSYLLAAVLLSRTGR